MVRGTQLDAGNPTVFVGKSKTVGLEDRWRMIIVAGEEYLQGVQVAMCQCFEYTILLCFR